MAAMTKRPKHAPAETEEVAALAAAVRELTIQVRQLALIMYEVREDLLGAVRNDQLDPCATRRMVDSYLSEGDGELADDESIPEVSPVSPSPTGRLRLPRQQQPTLFT